MTQEKLSRTQTRSRALSLAIAGNALSWLVGAFIYVFILLTASTGRSKYAQVGVLYSIRFAVL